MRVSSASELTGLREEYECRLPCKLVTFQPSLAQYRRAFFRKLGRCLRSLTVLHGSDPLPGEVPSLQSGIEGVNTIAVTHRKLGPAIWMPAMWHAAGNRRYDVAAFSWNSRYLHLPAAILRAKRAGMGVVLWGHAYSLSEGGFRRRYRNLLAGLADSVVTYNRRAAGELSGVGIPSDRVFVAPNSLDIESVDTAVLAWKREPEALRRFREGLGLDRNPVALYMSRLGNTANLRILVDVWSRVVAAVPDARLLIVGEGPARRELEARIRRSGLSSSVKCVGAVYGEHAVAPYFLSARLVLHPVKIGLTLNHAMSYGVPVVTFDDASRHSPEFEALEHGVNGMLAPNGDSRALAASARQILLDGELGAKLGCGARETMRTGYSLDRMIDGFLGAVRKAQERRGR
jgi:glycosyltransferase involved in cell wall biosynthesis